MLESLFDLLPLLVHPLHCRHHMVITHAFHNPGQVQYTSYRTLYLLALCGVEVCVSVLRDMALLFNINLSTCSILNYFIQVLPLVKNSSSPQLSMHLYVGMYFFL